MSVYCIPSTSPTCWPLASRRYLPWRVGAVRLDHHRHPGTPARRGQAGPHPGPGCVL